MCKLKAIILGVVVVLVIAAPGWAAPVTFNYFGSNGVNEFSGSFTMDDVLFNGSIFQPIVHSTITAFDFSVTPVAGGSPIQTWDLNDLVTTSSFTFDSSGPIPDVVRASGITAQPRNLSFFGRGAAQASGLGTISFDEGDWAVAPASVPTPLRHVAHGYRLTRVDWLSKVG